MQLLEKILGNMQDSIQRLWICLISRTEEKLPLFVPLILHSCSQTDHCIYTVPIGLRCNCAEDPQLFYLELAVFSTLVINSGSGWEVPGSLKQLLWKSGASSHGAARVLLRTTQGACVSLAVLVPPALQTLLWAAVAGCPVEEQSPSWQPHWSLSCQKQPFLPL